LNNPSKALAFMVRARVLKGTGGQDVLPVMWDDNFVTLLPGESKKISATYAATDLGKAQPVVVIEGWNLE
jgi:exo-1,4-beta-D-glucosaminidase